MGQSVTMTEVFEDTLALGLRWLVHVFWDKIVLGPGCQAHLTLPAIAVLHRLWTNDRAHQQTNKPTIQQTNNKHDWSQYFLAEVIFTPRALCS